MKNPNYWTIQRCQCNGNCVLESFLHQHLDFAFTYHFYSFFSLHLVEYRYHPKTMMSFSILYKNHHHHFTTLVAVIIDGVFETPSVFSRGAANSKAQTFSACNLARLPLFLLIVTFIEYKCPYQDHMPGRVQIIFLDNLIYYDQTLMNSNVLLRTL